MHITRRLDWLFVEQDFKWFFFYVRKYYVYPKKMMIREDKRTDETSRKAAQKRFINKIYHKHNSHTIVHFHFISGCGCVCVCVCVCAHGHKWRWKQYDAKSSKRMNDGETFWTLYAPKMVVDIIYLFFVI